MPNEPQDRPADWGARPTDAERVHGGLVGLAVADALGAPLEFQAPQACAAAVARGLEMAGGGIWEAGEFTDDTEMALALAESLVSCGGLDLEDLASAYIRWAAGPVKDIGSITAHALQGARSASACQLRARALQERTGRTAGNGTVMRAAPIGLFFLDPDEARKAALLDASLTHGDPVAGEASAALCGALIALRGGDDPVAAARAQARLPSRLSDVLEHDLGHQREVAELAAGAEFGTCWTALAVGLTAMSCRASYEDAVGWAISLGRDTDTNAAVTGALVGCRDGLGAIPDRWRDALRDGERVERAINALVDGE